MDNETTINALIANKVGGIDPNKISDGYHTFGELYEHRCALFIQLCKCYKDDCWFSLKHSDESSYDGWFILGLFKKSGQQITYHLPEKHLKEVRSFSEELEFAPEYDGHSPEDVIQRLNNL